MHIVPTNLLLIIIQIFTSVFFVSLELRGPVIFHGFRIREHKIGIEPRRRL